MLRCDESVRVDMRQIIHFAELIEPVSDAVWVHAVAVLLGKHISAVHPPVTEDQPQLFLFDFMLFKQFDRFRSEFDCAAPPILRR